jgi:hypothetical protein
MAKAIWIKGIEFTFTHALPGNYGIDSFTSETIFQYIKQNIKVTEGGLKELASVWEKEFGWVTYYEEINPAFYDAKGKYHPPREKYQWSQQNPRKLEWRFAQPPLAESEQDDWQIVEEPKTYEHAADLFRILMPIKNQLFDEEELTKAREVMRNLVTRFIHSHEAVNAWIERECEVFEKTEHPYGYGIHIGSIRQWINAKLHPYCLEIEGSRYELPKSIDTLFEDNSLSMNILSNDKPLKSVKRKVYSIDSFFDF